MSHSESKRKSIRVNMEAHVEACLLHNRPRSEEEDSLLYNTLRLKSTMVEKQFKGTLVNISPGAVLINKDKERLGPGGVLLITDEYIPAERVLILVFALRFEQGAEQFIVEARTLRVNEKDNDCYEVGVSFEKVINQKSFSDSLRNLDSLLQF